VLVVGDADGKWGWDEVRREGEGHEPRGRHFLDVFDSFVCPMTILSFRLADKGMGILISFEGGCWKLDLRVLSFGGETRTEVVDEDDAGTAGCNFGEGMAWDDKCKAGEDVEACRNEGGMKPVKSTLALSCIFIFFPPPSFVFPIFGIGDGDCVTDSFLDRNLIFDSILLSTLDLPPSLCTLGTSSLREAFSFSFSVFALIVAKSSAGGDGPFAFDRVADRNVCSSWERIFPKGFPKGSGSTSTMEEAVDASGLREDEAAGDARGLFVWNGCWDTIRIGNAAVAMNVSNIRQSDVTAIGWESGCQCQNRWCWQASEGAR
jgi:hypothetical protein